MYPKPTKLDRMATRAAAVIKPKELSIMTIGAYDDGQEILGITFL